MMKSLIATLILGLASGACAQSTQGVGRIAGEWVVYANDLEPSPVQAYFPNDPSVIGAHLIVTDTKIYWTAKDQSFKDTCNMPDIRDKTPASFDIFCSDGKKFGPDAHDSNFSSETSAQMSVKWYDGLILHLKKVGRASKP